MMNIEYLSCDICKTRIHLDESHEHPEFDIGGVPQNILTPYYSESREIPRPDSSRKGIGKYHEFLAFNPEERVCSTEGSTPLIEIISDSIEYNIMFKDETKNPTGSFKDRGIANMVSDALRKGYERIAIPSTGNAAISLGYYASRAGLESIVFIPSETPRSKVNKIKEKSEIIFDHDLIESYEHFFRFCRNDRSIYNGFPAINLPYLDGLKTEAFEIFLQNNNVPDWVIVPVGSGGNILGLYEGFRDIARKEENHKIPRIVPVQIKGADPITFGFTKKILNEVVVLEDMAESEAEAIASDTNFNYFKIMRLLEECKGIPISVTDEEINSAINTWNMMDLEFSSYSVFAALTKADFIRKEESVVLIGTARKRE